MTAPKGEQACIFCVAAAGQPSFESLTLYRNDHVMVMMNRYPYTNGHLMVAPNEHAAALFETGSATLTTLIRVGAEAQRILSDTYRPDGFNIGMNFGRAGGAGFADHYHMHIVPRWSGDSNFMTVTAETRMVPETLEQTWQRLETPFRGLRKDFSKGDE